MNICYIWSITEAYVYEYASKRMNIGCWQRIIGEGSGFRSATLKSLI